MSQANRIPDSAPTVADSHPAPEAAADRTIDVPPGQTAIFRNDGSGGGMAVKLTLAGAVKQQALDRHFENQSFARLACSAEKVCLAALIKLSRPIDLNELSQSERRYIVQQLADVRWDGRTLLLVDEDVANIAKVSGMGVSNVYAGIRGLKEARHILPTEVAKTGRRERDRYVIPTPDRLNFPESRQAIHVGPAEPTLFEKPDFDFTRPKSNDAFESGRAKSNDAFARARPKSNANDFGRAKSNDFSGPDSNPPDGLKTGLARAPLKSNSAHDNHENDNHHDECAGAEEKAEAERLLRGAVILGEALEENGIRALLKMPTCTTHFIQRAMRLTNLEMEKRRRVGKAFTNPRGYFFRCIEKPFPDRTPEEKRREALPEGKQEQISAVVEAEAAEAAEIRRQVERLGAVAEEDLRTAMQLAIDAAPNEFMATHWRKHTPADLLAPDLAVTLRPAVLDMLAKLGVIP